MVFPWCMCLERGEVGGEGREVERFLFSTPVRPLILLVYGPTLMTSFNINCLLKAVSRNTVTLEVRASTYEFGGVGGGVAGHNSVHKLGNLTSE